MKSERRFSSCWYNRFQGALYLLAFSTWGMGDAITSLWMIESRGIMCEGNFIARHIILNYGVSNFITIKIFITIGLLLIPFFIVDKPAYWIINGYYISYFTAGTLAMILNIQASRNEALFIMPELVIVLFISLILILTSIGEEIDKRNYMKLKSYFICILYDFSKIIRFMNHIFETKR